jgi:hypothetical protein
MTLFDLAAYALIAAGFSVAGFCIVASTLMVLDWWRGAYR